MGWRMLPGYVNRLPFIFSVAIFLFTGISDVLADQVTLSYIDASANPQAIVLDCNSSREDLALVADLIGQEGGIIANDPSAGCGTLAGIAAAVAVEAPVFAPYIARAFVNLYYDEIEMVVLAINKVSGVNSVAVRSAVNLDSKKPAANPQTDAGVKQPFTSLETVQEKRASRN